MATETRYSVRIPWVPREFRTQWHPTESVGPFAVLVRGAFKTEDEAVRWGQEQLNGTPYELVTFEAFEEE